MTFFSRPDLSDIQFKQLSDSSLHLSGTTYFMKPDGFQLLGDSGSTVPVIATGGTDGYVLTYMNGNVSLLPSSISGDTSFNSNRTTTRVGVPAVNVGGTTVTEFLEGYFFPSVKPTSSIKIGGYSTVNRDFGNDDTSSNSLAVTVTKKTNPISIVRVDTTGDGNYNETPVNDPNGITGNYNGNFAYSIYDSNIPTPPNPNLVKTTITYKVEGVTTANETTTSTAKINWMFRVFYFLDGNLYVAGNDSTLIGIANGLTGNQALLAVNKSKSLTLTINNEFFYYMYPKLFGLPSFKVNGLPNNAWGNPSIGTLFEIAFINNYNYHSDYYVARSDNKITGNYIIEIT